MECLKPATELKLVSCGNEFQAFIYMLTGKTRPCTGVTASFEHFKTVPTCVLIEEICRDTQSEDESESNNTTEEEESDDTDVTGKSGALLYCCNRGHFYDLRFPIYNHPCCPAHNLWLCSTNRKRVGLYVLACLFIQRVKRVRAT